MMCTVIANPTSNKVHALIHFLHAKNMTAAEIHRELCMAVYSQNVMSEGTVRDWCRVSKDGQIDVRDEEQSGWPTIYSE
jgi:hypothetical protein